MSQSSIPRVFVAAGRKRSLIVLATFTLISGAAMLPAMAAMADHGASIIAFESAGSVSRSAEILAEWGDPGEEAAWWQLALDLPLLIGYGLFLAGACAAVARRARESGRPRLERAASMLVWLGPLAATADLLQNISLAIVLSGHVAQPWIRISAITGPTITTLAVAAGLFALVGAIATRSPASPETSAPDTAS